MPAILGGAFELGEVIHRDRPTWAGGPAAGRPSVDDRGAYVGIAATTDEAKSLSARLCCTSGSESVTIRTTSRAWLVEDDLIATRCAVTSAGVVIAFRELMNPSHAALTLVTAPELN